MFSQARVKNSVVWGVYPSMHWAGVSARGCVCLGGVCPGGGSGVSAWGPAQGGRHPLVPKADIPPSPEMATGTHPTGMHSCSLFVYIYANYWREIWPQLTYVLAVAAKFSHSQLTCWLWPRTQTQLSLPLTEANNQHFRT